MIAMRLMVIGPLLLALCTPATATTQAADGDAYDASIEAVLINGPADQRQALASTDPARAIPVLEAALANAKQRPDYPTYDDMTLLDALLQAHLTAGNVRQADALMNQSAAGWRQQDAITADQKDQIEAIHWAMRDQMSQRMMQEGRWAEAEELFTRLAARGRSLYQSNSDSFELTPILGLARVIALQGRAGEAETLYRDFITLIDQTAPANPYLGATARMMLGDMLGEEQRFEEALALVEPAYDFYLQEDGPEAITTQSAAVALGQMLFSTGEQERGRDLLFETFQLQRRTKGLENLDTLRTANSLALLLNEKGEHDAAVQLLKAVVSGIEKLRGPDHFEAAAARVNLAEALAQSGNDPAAALDLARRAVVDVLRIRREAAAFAPRSEGRTNLGDRLPFFTLANTAYDAVGKVDVSTGRLFGDAFLALQMAMAEPLSEGLARKTALALAAKQGGEAETLVRQLIDADESYRDQTTRRNTIVTAGSVDQRALAQITDQRAALARQITTLRKQLDSVFPTYGQLVDGPTLSPRAAMDLVKGTDDVIMLVVPSPLGTQIVTIADEDIEWERSAITNLGLREPLRRILWDLGANVQVSDEEHYTWLDEGEGVYPFDRSTAYELYQQLVAPVAGKLEGKRHIYVVAGGALASLPFGVLVTEQPEGPDGDPATLRATSWFGDQAALIQMPSIDALAMLRQLERERVDPTTIDFLGFGDPVLRGQSASRGVTQATRAGGRLRNTGLVGGASKADPETGLVNPDTLRALSRLPGTRTELLEIKAALGVGDDAVFLDVAASETAFKRAPLGEARIIALATHGLLGGELGEGIEPGLVFTPPASASLLDDGYLTMSEIAALDLAAQWIILSACNTAAGDGTLGAPGLSGLAKSFFQAGAQSLLASHWPVRDKVAARMTVRIIEIARENPQLSRAEALQRAMREIRDDASYDSETDTWAHPNAWAPFTLIGDATRAE